MTVASTPEDSYNKQIEVVEAAEAYLKSRNVTVFDFGGATAATPTAIAELRQRLSIHAGTPLIVASSHLPPDMPLDNLPEAVFVTASDTALTHRTVESNIAAAPDDARVVFDRENGLFATGETVVKANRALDIAQRGANIIAAANQMGVYTAPDVRGWGETLPKAEETRRQFDGEVVLITGAASGIGKATAEVFMARGAAVVSIDIDEAIIGMFDSPAFVGVHGDVRNVDDVKRAVEACVKTYGGMDMVFLNAGINEDHAPLEDANMELWQRVMTTNVDGNVVVLKAVYELLKRAPEGGRIIMNASKSAPAPGPGSSSYTVSKAAITQLGRLTALEWGKDNIRVYVVHPNAVFDTKIWKDNMAEKRAKHYGLTLQQYKTNNLLKVEIMARDVGELVADLCGDHFRKVTGIQLPIDGGNNRVI
ncbi:MAG: SDR family oxidoreductase [Chloroflexota bacterium]